MTDEEAARVVAAGLSWVGTPYHHNASVKGCGVDCAQLIKAAHVEAGVVDDFAVAKYTHDWHLHRSEECYLATVEAYLEPVDGLESPLVDRGSGAAFRPATVLLWRMGRTFSHAALVTEWPVVVHAYFPARMVVLDRLHEGHPLARREMRAYRLGGPA